MNWVAAQIIFKAKDRDMAEELISSIFYKLDLKGVVVENPDEKRGSEWGDDAVEKPKHHSVTGYLPLDNEIEEKKILIESEADLLKKHNINCRVNYIVVNEEDWAESWKEFFWPEKITENIVVKPTWREYKKKDNEMIIEIDPGMAFGTGTHGTTSLCIKAIEKYLKPYDSFLDIGTGSGILMVAAHKLGAEKLIGVDNDGVAVDIAVKNMNLNGIYDGFDVVKGDLSSSINDKYDFVAANILAEIILILVPDIPRVLKKGGLFLSSGIISEKKDMVVDELINKGFEIIEIDEKESWISIISRLA